MAVAHITGPVTITDPQHAHLDKHGLLAANPDPKTQALIVEAFRNAQFRVSKQGGIREGFTLAVLDDSGYVQFVYMEGNPADWKEDFLDQAVNRPIERRGDHNYDVRVYGFAPSDNQICEEIITAEIDILLSATPSAEYEALLRAYHAGPTAN